MNKRKLFLVSGIAIFSAVLLFSCIKKVGNLPVETPPPALGFCDTITYNKHVKKIIDNNCVSCHGPSLISGGTSLVNYAEVKTKADEGRIKARVFDEDPTRMPAAPNNPLTASEKQILKCWLENGKKE